MYETEKNKSLTFAAIAFEMRNYSRRYYVYCMYSARPVGMGIAEHIKFFMLWHGPFRSFRHLLDLFKFQILNLKLGFANNRPLYPCVSRDHRKLSVDTT